MTARAWLAIAAVLLAFPVSARPSLAPSAATPEAADMTVTITAKTKVVNVFENDTVLFKVGEAQFALKFDGNSVRYNLETLAPPGVLTHRVTVYVSPNPADHELGIP
jgi:hypothetical protein